MQFDQRVVQGDTQGEIESGIKRPIPVPGSDDEVQDDTPCVPKPEKVCRLNLLLCKATLYIII